MRARWVRAATAALWCGTILPAAAQTPTPSPSPETAKPSVRRENGKTIIESNEGSLVISSRVQLRWTQEMPEETLGGGSGGLVPAAPPRGDRGSFRIPRAKTELSGWIWRKALTFELQLSWAGPEAGASTQTPIEDLVISWRAFRSGAAVVSFGQFKVPFGRQEHASSSQLQFVDRDILSHEFTRGRDIGVELAGLLRGKLEYKAGIFNGNPASRLDNENDKYQFNGRVTYMPFGAFKYSECDFESTDRPLLALAGQFEHNDQHGSTNADDFKTVIWGADVAVKYRGFSAFAEYFSRSREPEISPRFDSPGFHAQAGFFLIRRQLELALRYAWYDPSRAIPNNDRSEVGGAVNYFLKKHLLKIQADLRSLQDQARGTSDQELRIQTSVVF